MVIAITFASLISVKSTAGIGNFSKKPALPLTSEVMAAPTSDQKECILVHGTLLRSMSTTCVKRKSVKGALNCEKPCKSASHWPGCSSNSCKATVAGSSTFTALPGKSEGSADIKVRNLLLRSSWLADKDLRSASLKKDSTILGTGIFRITAEMSSMALSMSSLVIFLFCATLAALSKTSLNLPPLHASICDMMSNEAFVSTCSTAWIF